jgi:uncharacterized protein YjbI with pentapeptide repeats
LSDDFANVNLAGQNLSNAKFHVATLTGANLSQANVTNVAFDSADLTGANLSHANLTKANFVGDYLSANLTNANLSSANLTDAILYNANLTGANLTGAEVRGANFDTTTITPAQLASTASYQGHDLTGIVLSTTNLAGVNLVGQNLANAYFVSATLTNANFTGANLANASFDGATLTNANLSFADTRGSTIYSADDLTGAVMRNTILPDGTIAGLDLAAGERLAVRAYDGDPSRGIGPIPVTVQNHVTLGNGSALTVSGGTLRFTLTSGSPTIGTGVTAVVSSGATLELAGSVSALANGANRVNITNNSNAPGILVSGTHRQVGNIDGSGITQVNESSDLTANHIVQSVLVIGGTAGSPGLVTIDASDATGNPLGQSSGLVVAGSLTHSGPFGAGETTFTNLSSGDSNDPAALSLGNSAAGGNPFSVPEPSTRLLMLLALLVLFCAHFARHCFRCQTV